MPRVMLFTKEIVKKLTNNGQKTADIASQPNYDGDSPDHVPVVKIYNPYGGAVWLITEMDPSEPDRMFGLCDMGFGFPELGYVSRRDLENVQPVKGLFLERDKFFRTTKPLSEYTEQARIKGRIVA